MFEGIQATLQVVSFLTDILLPLAFGNFLGNFHKIYKKFHKTMVFILILFRIESASHHAPPGLSTTRHITCNFYHISILSCHPKSLLAPKTDLTTNLKIITNKGVPQGKVKSNPIGIIIYSYQIEKPFRALRAIKRSIHLLQVNHCNRVIFIGENL